MLNKVTLTNFRRHESLSVDFGGGLNVLRGLNEHGKSTVFEAVAYALFGVKALRDSLEDTVTWGSDVKTLKVELDFRVDDVSYNIRRSKSSCELNSDGLKVTGQNEVSNYVAKLLKVDAGAAARLTMSSQTEIRGALEAGPKATTELIEKLAEFDQIDHLIDLMQAKLTLGSAATLEAGITAAQDSLARAQSLAVPFDEQALKATIVKAKAHLEVVTQELAKAEAREAEAGEAHSAVRERIIKRDSLQREAEHALGNVQALEKKLKDLKDVVVVEGLAQKIAALQARVEASKNAEVLQSAYAAVSPYLSRAAGPSFTGTVDELTSAQRAAERSMVEANTKVSTLQGDLRVLEQQLTHGTCTFCGKDFSGVPEVESRNAETRAKIAATTVALDAQVKRVDALKRQVSEYSLVEHSTRPVLRAMDRASGYCEVVDNILPPVLKWTGPAVDAEPENVPVLLATIKSMQDGQRDYDRAIAQRETLAEQLAAAKVVADQRAKELESLPLETNVVAKAALDEARSETAGLRARLSTAKDTLADAQRALKDEAAALERAKAQVESSRALLDQRNKELSELEFNNALLKRVRQCRPAIADKLWSIVLTAVSSYFTEIRGVRSTVTKGAAGFEVDGHSIASMSGSTLDAVGLAIRVALVRTFLPTAPFLLLDEPAAAMDAHRTDNMLGFLASTGFQQILLITHEDVSETVADHIINLGD